jgi:hypothetical protein
MADFNPHREIIDQLRAMVIVADSRSKKIGQRYTDPLLVLSWEE